MLLLFMKKIVESNARDCKLRALKNVAYFLNLSFGICVSLRTGYDILCLLYEGFFVKKNFIHHIVLKNVLWVEIRLLVNAGM